MTRLLITGADGFVGRWLVRAAREAGIDVVAAILPTVVAPAEWRAESPAGASVQVATADLRDRTDVAKLAAFKPDTVIHLAAMASGNAARADPAAAVAINVTATATLAAALADASPRFLFTSTAEVYGSGHGGPISESAAVKPVSPYAASKARAEAALEAAPLPVIIARAFSHTGPGQATSYVLPALAARLAAARRSGTDQVKTGNLAAVRDFLDVRDVVRAYLLLLERGVPGEIYNVAGGVGHRLSDCFEQLARLVGVAARAVPDASLLRPADIPVLIGDATKLRTTLGWSPKIPFERTLQDLVNAQAD